MRRSNLPNRAGVSSGGPLMTNHLHDLELELELLKRKRYLIQQQQQDIFYQRTSLSTNSQFHEPARDAYSRFDEPRDRDFSHLYDERQRDAGLDRPFAPKRKAFDPDWQLNLTGRFLAPAKRPRQDLALLNIEQRVSQNYQRPMPFDKRPNTIHPVPLMGIKQIGPRRTLRPQAPSSTPKRVPFQKPGNKTTHQLSKENKTVGINKPNHSKSSSSHSQAASATNECFILKAGQEPSARMTGRLELVLGNILKEIRAVYEPSPEYSECFKDPSLLRLLKQGIRERIRSANLGKRVEIVSDIQAAFRRTYPTATDVEIVQHVAFEQQKKDEQESLAITLLEEGDPKTFFTNNMTKLLIVKLDEMFEKVEQLYKNERKKSNAEIVEKLPDPASMTADTDEKVKQEKEVDANDSEQPVENEKMDKEEYYKNLMEGLIENMLPNLLPRYKEHIIKLLNMDRMYHLTKGAIMLRANKKSLDMVEKTEEAAASSENKAVAPVIPYYVKVYGTPRMPSRKVTQEFLNNYNPKSIKKHKKYPNLLFVGLATKDDYDTILAANKTVLGNVTLFIKASNPTGDAPAAPEAANTDDVQIIEDKQGSQDVDLLSPGLDDQIDDLLSSIRKADEDAKKNGNNTDEKQEDNDDAVEIQNTCCDGKTEPINDENGNDNEEVENTEDAKATEEAEPKVNEEESVKEDDVVAPLKSEAKALATPVKASARVPATPSSIRTRRASKLAQNN